MTMHNSSHDARTFSEIVKGFYKKFAEFNPQERAISIQDFFGKGVGVKTSLSKLKEKKIIDTDEDFQGIYIFFDGKEPQYVGISRFVVARLQGHVKGKSHHISSLAYRLALIEFEKINGEPFRGKRKDLDFGKYIGPTQEKLKEMKVALLPILSDVEMYLFEVYCAMKLNTPYNDFRTH